MQLRLDIQGLRALAFIFVFIYHLNSNWLPGGFIGVDMFFVISAYLITTIIQHQKNNNSFKLADFFEKRIKRIVPAYYITLLFVALIGSYTFLYIDLFLLRGTILRSLPFISNIFFSQGESYFGAKSSENPLLHTWSLAIEMQFYFILPLILKYINNRYLLKIFISLFILCISYGCYELYIKENANMYFSLIARFPEFLVGVIFSILTFNKQFSTKQSTALTAVGFILIIGSLIFINEHVKFPGLLALIPCIGTAFLLIASINPINNFLSYKPLVYIGELSYSLYLFHWPIMAFIRYKNNSYQFTLFEIVEISLLTFILAWICYTYIESTYRKLTNKSFIYKFAPITILTFASWFFLIKLNENKKIKEEFVTSVFGLKSHTHDYVETLGDLKAKDQGILLIGDSHAMNFKYFLNKVGHEFQFNFNTITTNSFIALDGIDRNGVSPELLKFYDSSRTLIPTTKKQIELSKLIIINIFNKSLYTNPSYSFALEKLIKSLKKDQKILFINTFPVFEKNPLRINHGIIKTSELEFLKILYDKEKDNLLLKLSEKYPNVYYYDISKSKAFNNAPYYNDTVMYYDENHLNIFGTQKLVDDLKVDFTKFLTSIQ